MDELRKQYIHRLADAGADLFLARTGISLDSCEYRKTAQDAYQVMVAVLFEFDRSFGGGLPPDPSSN